MSRINWAELKKKKTEVEPLMALVMGASGGGKSSSLGTLGVPTLVLYGNVESHSANAAKATSQEKSNVVGMQYTVNRADGSLDAQASYKNLLAILRDPGVAENFGAVAVDSAGELQQVFKETARFKELVTTDTGKVNNFKEPEAYGTMFGEVINSMLALRRQGVHTLMTCAAIVTGGTEGSDEITARPNLYGYTVSENLCRAFADIFYVTMLREENEEGEEITVHRFVFNPKVSAVSKDVKSGKITKQSFSNFSPRISLFTREQLPERAEVNFAKIIEARKAKV
jgi:hypothetical protein